MRRSSLIIVGALFLISTLVVGCGDGTAPDNGGVAPLDGAPPAGGLTAGAPAFDPEEGIVIYTWPDSIDPEIYADFQELTEIEISEDYFSDNKELLVTLAGGASRYAVIAPSDFTVTLLRQQNMLATLDHANIPNLSNLSERFRNLPYDPGNQYCVPFLWGMTGIGYLEGRVSPPSSWAALFDPDPNTPQYGRATMLDDAREAFAAALIYLGYDVNTTDEAQLLQAKDMLIRAKSGLSGYNSVSYDGSLASEDSLMAHGWNKAFLRVQEVNENLQFVVPEEGGVIRVDNLCIPRTVPPDRKAAAESFINYMLTPEVGAQLAEWNYYASPNGAAEEYLGEGILRDPAVYPPAAVIDQLQYIRSVGERDMLFEQLWEEVKSAPGP